MGRTYSEKVVKNKLFRGEAVAGKQAVVNVDVLMTHDVCGPPTIGIFKREFGKNAKVWDRNKVVLIPDHYIFTSDATAKRNVQVLREFAAEQGITNFYDVGTPRYSGVCHTTLLNNVHLLPAEILIGTDSHTTTAGAVGFGMGVGNTPGAFVMGSGKMVMNTPYSMKFDFDGKFPAYVSGKDVILQIIGDIGTDGADFKSMEFGGEAIRGEQGLSLEQMAVLCNMSIEAGGNGLVVPNERTRAYLKLMLAQMSNNPRAREFEKRLAAIDLDVLQSDSDASYVFNKRYDASRLEPLVAMPHSPGNVKRVMDVKDTKLHSAYLGSCTGGNTEDFLESARMLDAAGKQVAIPLYVVPATQGVVDFVSNRKIRNRTLRQIFEDAGADMKSFDQPSCAACLGGPRDTYGRINDSEPHDRISATNRNFPKRMGEKGNVYLASPLTVIASALTGKITDPREFMN